MPQAITSPRRDLSRGRNTAASLGPSSVIPVSGLTTLPPCTSWSYCRMTHSLLATLSEPRIARRAGVWSARGSEGPDSGRAGAGW